MRIVIDARELRTSTGRYVERLLFYLQEIDTVNTYLVLLKPQDVDGWRTKNEHFSKVPCPHKEFTFAEQLALKKQIEGLQPDLVHFTVAQQPIFYTGRKITTIHDLTTLRFANPDKNALVFKIKQQIYARVIKHAAKTSVAVITPTQFVKADVVNFARLNPDKVTVTLESADKITAPPTPLPYLQNKHFIMYVGRPTPHKNLPRLIEVFSLLRANHPDLQLVLAGKEDANYRRIAAAVQARAIKNVVFTGFIEDAALRWLYEHCAAYVFPSLSEGFGLPGLEAMQHGAPVVSSNATCLPEVYGAAAHYFEPADVSGMADAINEVLTDKDLRARLISAGHRQVQGYSWRRMAEQTLAIYNQALGS